jgi:hypothetical protein
MVPRHILLILIYIFNRSWVDTRWQQYSTHLHTNSTHNTAVQHTFTHKQYTPYSSTAHIYTQTVHTIQQYSTHLHNTENGTYITKKNGKCWPCPVFASYTLAFALQLRKKHRETSVMVVKKSLHIPVAVVQYTFTHKLYTEKHSGTECTEQNMIHITTEYCWN